jgi:L-alanine-DL-glutamate epimerase-like enolase superfamily enzyme
MSDRVKTLDVFSITIPRDTPYLGALRTGEAINPQGYFVRKGNRTVYANVDRNVVVRIETEQGIVGWGETYGLIVPRATMALITDLLAQFVVGRDPADADAIHEELYDLQRVRGYGGGYYMDALAAINIALWDAAGKIAGASVADLLGGRKHETLPAYVSGLPASTLAERAALAKEWQGRGFNAFKYAAPVADDGNVAELAGLREALGPEARIACDMHWAHTPDEAIALIRQMEPHGLWFAEAPIAPEDIEGLAKVAAGVSATVAAGEEWRTVYEAELRVPRRAISLLQPEMGHIGITEFMKFGRLAEQHNCEVIPHATIGIGIFLAASLQASVALKGVTCHEYQHSVFEPNRSLINSSMDCRDGTYVVPSVPGLGVEPSEKALRLLQRAE